MRKLLKNFPFIKRQQFPYASFKLNYGECLRTCTWLISDEDTARRIHFWCHINLSVQEIFPERAEGSFKKKKCWGAICENGEKKKKNPNTQVGFWNFLGVIATAGPLIPLALVRSTVKLSRSKISDQFICDESGVSSINMDWNKFDADIKQLILSALNFVRERLKSYPIVWSYSS